MAAFASVGVVAGSGLGQTQAPARRPQTSAPASPGAAAPTRKAESPPPVDERTQALQRQQMEQLLVLWEKQSARLTTLDVGFDRVDKSDAWGDEKYKGRAYFQAPNLACIHTQKVEDKKAVDQERIVCSGKDVYQYNFETRQIFVFPLDKDQRKKALEEGPLPFLFNMKADEVKQRYQMQLLNQDERAYLIGVLPRLKEDRAVFSQAFLQLNKKNFLPDRLLLVSPNGKDTQDYVFSGVSANQKVDPNLFRGVKVAGWKEIYNPTPEQMQKAVDDARGPRVERGARQPAVGRAGAGTAPAPRQR